MMGTEGLTQATKIAILNANYLAACLKDTYGIVYRGATGFVGHEMILECRKVHEETGISENDIAERLWTTAIMHRLSPSLFTAH